MSDTKEKKHTEEDVPVYQFADLSCREFTERLSSKAPVPGGGGASALVGALGASLCNMVGNLTVGKKKYKDVEAEILSLMEKVTALQSELLDCIEEDARAFAPLAAAYSLPQTTPEEKAQKEKVMEEALKNACEAPMHIMRTICSVIATIRTFQTKGSVLAVSDAGVAATLSSAALRGASLNVYINTKSMKNREYAEQLNRECDEMLDTYCTLADQIFREVFEKLNPGVKE
ncbi:MAG: cyclodeaminase/cyclohydrolase family protein [Bilifractor sp.]